MGSEMCIRDSSCGRFRLSYYADYGASQIVDIFDLSDDGDSTADYEAHVRMYLQPAWDAFGITSDDIGKLV